MAKFSKKVMGKEVGDAKVYAPPHTMDGKPLKIKDTLLCQLHKAGNLLGRRKRPDCRWEVVLCEPFNSGR